MAAFVRGSAILFALPTHELPECCYISTLKSNRNLAIIICAASFDEEMVSIGCHNNPSESKDKEFVTL